MRLNASRGLVRQGECVRAQPIDEAGLAAHFIAENDNGEHVIGMVRHVIGLVVGTVIDERPSHASTYTYVLLYTTVLADDDLPHAIVPHDDVRVDHVSQQGFGTDGQGRVRDFAVHESKVELSELDKSKAHEEQHLQDDDGIDVGGRSDFVEGDGDNVIPDDDTVGGYDRDPSRDVRYVPRPLFFQIFAHETKYLGDGGQLNNDHEGIDITNAGQESNANEHDGRADRVLYETKRVFADGDHVRVSKATDAFGKQVGEGRKSLEEEGEHVKGED